MDAMEQQDIEPAAPSEALPLLMQYAQMDGDISEHIESHDLAALADQICEQYDRDKESRDNWEDVATKALEDMARTDYPDKDYPWQKASNVHYPLLQTAVMQFNARAYPAIVKGDEAVSVKVVGKDDGMPMMGPDGQPMVVGPQGPMPAAMAAKMPPEMQQQLKPAMARLPGEKAKRAERVADFMNTVLFYRMDNWEGETDTLLFQLPAVGVGFRKSWYDGKKHQSRFVPALKLVVDNDSATLADAPQIAEEIDGVFPHQIRRDMATGRYRTVPMDPNEHEAKTLLEVQCYYDLDDDGIDEPYIVTLDYKEKEILRVVPDFGPEQIEATEEGIAYIERREFYVKYEFLPHPEGKFYNTGLAHLLDQYTSVINTILNQMIDANHAATAGGGFIGSGLSIQGKGQASMLRWQPGEYKTVSVAGAALRDGIYERTFPQISPVMFNLLDMILGAAKDIASIKDVLSGDASNQGQVGTTLALIEQGLQVFTAIYKRVYRGLKTEYAMLYKNIALYADESVAQDYIELLDDPAANFAEDFNAEDMDIRPVSDPSSVTKMQKMARAQFLMGTAELLGAVGGDPREALQRMYEAADVEDIEKLLPPPQPNPMQEMAAKMELENTQADTQQKIAKAAKDMADAQSKGPEMAQKGAIEKGKQDIEAAKLQLAAFEAGQSDD